MMNKKLSVDGNGEISLEQRSLMVKSLVAAHPDGIPFHLNNAITVEVLVAASDYLNFEQYKVLLARAAHGVQLGASANAKLEALIANGWKGNDTREPLLIADPFQKQ